MSISLERFTELRSQMRAFTVKDLQQLGVMVSWSRQCGFMVEELIDFATWIPIVVTIEQIGASPQVETARFVKSLEQQLPKELRGPLRRKRLQETAKGRLHK